MKVSGSDFEWGEVLGEGSYSKVVRARRKATGELFAVKMVEKALVLREKKQKYVVMEKDVLNRCRHPNVVKLFCTFQDPHRLFFVMELCETELFQLLQDKGSFALPCARFFAAELAVTLRFIHGQAVMHR